MPLIVVGINHEDAPVDVREKLAILDRELPQALEELTALPSVAECAILSTCNRTEAYVVSSPDDPGLPKAVADALSARRGLSHEKFERFLRTRRDGAAAGHLFSVAAGLNSMILGEPDVQRQVKHALEAAQAARTAGTLINRLFQDALAAGKRVRTETEIARGALSVGAAAVDLATQIFGESLAHNTVLVLGAGKMSEITARHLHAKGSPAILVANRTFERACQLAEQFGGEARRFDELAHLLVRADIVICSTAAPHPILTFDLVKEAMRARHNRPLSLIDIAVPRDVEESVDSLDNVYLFNIDHLQDMVAGARQARSAEVARANVIIDSAVAEYLRWGRSLEATPLIIAVREKLDSVRLGELARLRARLPGLSDKEWRSVEAAMESLTSKIAHPATLAIREGAETGKTASLETIRQAFGLKADEASSDPAADRLPAPKQPRKADSP